MKTLKLTMVAALVAFLLVNVASADDFRSKPRFSKVTNLTLDKAKTNPGMVTAMYAQLNMGELLKSAGDIYIGEVKFHGQLYRISGTYIDWLRFFRLQIDPPMHHKEVMKGIE